MMKKEYTLPQVEITDFQVAGNIADISFVGPNGTPDNGDNQD